MMAKAPTDAQATSMVKNWLHSPEHFCIAPNGDFAGNKDTCYWGLPSIEASDPAFPPLGYWRGYVCELVTPSACNLSLASGLSLTNGRAQGVRWRS